MEVGLRLVAHQSVELTTIELGVESTGRSVFSRRTELYYPGQTWWHYQTNPQEPGRIICFPAKSWDATISSGPLTVVVLPALICHLEVSRDKGIRARACIYIAEMDY